MARRRDGNGGNDQAANGADGGTGGIAEKVGNVTSDGLPKKLLIPATVAAVTAAAGYAATKGAPKVRSAAVSKAEDAAEGALDEAEGRGGVTGLAAKVMKKGGEGGGGGGGPLSGVAGAVTSKLGGGNKEPSAGWGKGRRNPVQRWVDVAVPLETAYNQWTQFEEFPKFMHRVVSVKQDEEERQKLHWEEKIWFSRRQWEAEIIEQIPDERIAWRTVSGTSHVGHVTFHRLDDELTRVMVSIDFNPSGMMEKMASGLRFVKRAAESDLARFKAFIETHGEETGAWRGRIEDAEVVRDVKPKEGKPIEADKDRHTPENVGKEKKPKKGDDGDDRGDEGGEEGQRQEQGQRSERSERRDRSERRSRQPSGDDSAERRQRQARRQQRRERTAA